MGREKPDRSSRKKKRLVQRIGRGGGRENAPPRVSFDGPFGFVVEPFPAVGGDGVPPVFVCLVARHDDAFGGDERAEAVQELCLDFPANTPLGRFFLFKTKNRVLD